MTSFHSMPLPDSLAKALQALQFNTPTEIQAAAIPIALKGKDLMACAQTGSGKTAAYCLPILVTLLADDSKNALILAPTRELAAQIAEVVRDLTVYSKHLKMATLVGGADMRKQIRALQAKPRIVVATPGRLNDHLKRRSLQLNNTAMLVLDEGDRMIDMGFAPQLEIILKFLPKERQTLFFTATLSPKVRKLAEKYLQMPESISVGKSDQPVEKIKQTVIQVSQQEKDERLVDELNKRQGSVIVFAKTKRKTDELARFLNDYGFTVSLIHGDRTQGQRNQAIQNFRTGKYRILCATDVAARGIDIPAIEHVINYDLPMMIEDYVHRIGRTARNGAEGEAVSFVSPSDHRNWLSIARKYKIKDVELKAVPRERRGEREEGGRRGKRPGFGKSFGGPRGQKPFGEKRSFKREYKDSDYNDFGNDFSAPVEKQERSFKRKFEGGEGRTFKRKFDQGDERASFRRNFDQGDERPSFKRKFDQGDERPSFKRKFDQNEERPFKRKFDRDEKPFKRKFDDGAERPYKRKFDDSGEGRDEGRKPFGRKPFGGGGPGGFKKGGRKPFGSSKSARF